MVLARRWAETHSRFEVHPQFVIDNSMCVRGAAALERPVQQGILRGVQSGLFSTAAYATPARFPAELRPLSHRPSPWLGTAISTQMISLCVLEIACNLLSGMA